MTGLMLSDILTLKKAIRLYLLVSVVYMIIGISSGGGTNMVSFIVFFGVMLVIASFSYNDMSHWDRYVNTTPIRRIDVVLAKYLLAFLTVAATTVIGMVFIIIGDSMHGRPMAEDLAAMVVVGAVGLVYVSIMLPLLFKFPVEKTRMFLIVLFLLPFVLIVLLPKAIDVRSIEAFLESLSAEFIVGTGIAALIVLMCISLFLSIYIYKNKEF